MKKATYVGDHGRGGQGLDDCAVVLLGRYGCRNRQAARGPRRPWVNSPWCCLGSSPPTRERQGANKCRKPESWWQNREIGGGFPFNGPAKAAPGSTCRWKTLCVADVAPFDEGAAEPALAPRVLWVTRDRGATESVRGRSPAWHAADNAVTRQPRSRGALLASSRREVVDTTEVGGAPSIACPPEVGPIEPPDFDQETIWPGAAAVS
jgi:hypothetical protein